MHSKTPSHSGTRMAERRSGSCGSRPYDLQLETIIDRYSLSEKIGHGGTSTVYAAHDKDRLVALKIANRKDDNPLIENEALCLRILRHRNLVEMVADGEFQGRRYLVMEHLEGDSLSSAIIAAHDNGTPIPWSDSKDIILQLCDVLAYSHGRGILHGDVKASNVFLEGEPGAFNAKLLDLGLAARLARAVKTRPTDIGTCYYMAPELARGAPFDHRVDIYAMGVLIHKMVTGELPFDSGIHSEVLMMQQKQIPIAPSARYPWLGIPIDIDGVVLRALEKEPGRRLPLHQMRAMIEYSKGPVAVETTAKLIDRDEPTSNPRRACG